MSPDKGAFELEIGAFEDVGARWKLALEEIDRFLIARLACMHELWAGWGDDAVPLYRAAAADGPLSPTSPSSLISATFSRDVAEAHFERGLTAHTAVLWRQRVAITRVLMTFLETAALNRPFRQAEAVLIADAANRAF